MKVMWVMFLFLYALSAWSGAPIPAKVSTQGYMGKMDCREMKKEKENRTLLRCENSKVICFVTRTGNLSCNFKTRQK